MRNHTSNFNFSLSAEVTASTHDDGIVILHTGKGRVFSSNKTGTVIWQAIEQGRSLDGIVEEISSRFQIAATTARTHALKFLAALEQQALIRREVAS
jgi:Coenzyme PQQ synthesis protein D (PqqD)